MPRVKTAKPTRRSRRAKDADAPIFAAPPVPVTSPDLSPTPPARHHFFSRSSRRKKPETSIVTTLDEFCAALSDQKVQITLGNDIIVKHSIVIDYDVAIDFNGHNLISEQTAHDFRVLDIRRGEVTLTGTGKIFALGMASIAIRIFGAISASVPNYTTVTIDEHIELFAPEGRGILISANLGAAYGVTLNFAGKITARSGICLGHGVRGMDGNLPAINVKNGASITADEEYGAALEAAGLGIWKIGAARLYGLGGLWLQLGSATLEHTHIFSRLTSITMDSLPGVNLSLEIHDGIYLSAGGYAVSGNPDAVARFEVSDGVYAGAEGVFSDELMPIVDVTGGDFSTDVKSVWSEFAPSDLPFPTFIVKEDIASDTTPAAVSESSEPVTPEADTSSETLIIPKSTPKSASKSSKTKKSSASKRSTSSKTKKTSSAPKENKLLLPTKPAISKPPKPVVSGPIELTVSPVFSTVVPKFEVIASPITVSSNSTMPEPVLSSAPVSVDPERTALIDSLLEAIAAMRELRPSDYGYGYEELQTIVASAEVALNDPELTVAEISSFAAEILQAFDQLEERDDLSLSDDELDQLFYQGAVLQEVALNTSPAVEHGIVAELTSATDEPAYDDLDDADFGNSIDDEAEIDSDLSILAALTGVAPAAPDISTSPATTFAPEEPENPVSRAPKVYTPKVRSAVPISPKAPPIDEFAPSAQWTTGTTMIDELTPVNYDGPAIRYRRRSFSKFYRSLSAGVRAGVAAFNASRHGVRT